MKWSLRLGRFFGIDTNVHVTFLLLLAWSAINGLGEGGTLLAAAFGVIFMIAVFASVLAHELGHALTARAFGIETRQILLTPLGGMAEIESGVMRPRVEMLIALAGPAVSLALGGLLMLLAGSFATLSPASFLGALAWANLMIGLFNLVPAFPMDGGRVLRAWLAGRMHYVRATGIAADIGKYAAIAFALLGVFYNPMLILIAGFVYLAGRAEASSVAARIGDPYLDAPPRGGWRRGHPGYDARYDDPPRARRPRARRVVIHNGRLYVVEDD
ncbi:MAG: site-2 protease family protein [Nannocystaceae bacterium]|nr:site-2 protease family protein [Myxococcales bacterium]